MIGALTSFRALYPDVLVRYMTDTRVFRLEYGEAHVALRAGAAPQEPDNVVQSFARQDIALYGSEDYIAQHGKLRSEAELPEHWFVGYDDPDSRAPFHRWLMERVSRDRLVFRVPDSRLQEDAVRQGAGLGFMSVAEAERIGGLVQVLPPQEDWTSPLWLVTHVDLHRTPKVQAFLSHLKAFAAERGLR